LRNLHRARQRHPEIRDLALVLLGSGIAARKVEHWCRSKLIRLAKRDVRTAATEASRIVAGGETILASPAVRRSHRPKFPIADPKLLEALAPRAKGARRRLLARPRADLRRATARRVFAALYEDEDLVCCGWSQREFDTRPAREWTDPGACEFVVPNPMRKAWGLALAGHRSPKTLDNAARRRRWLVTEIDLYKDDEHPEGAILKRHGLSVHQMCWAVIEALEALRLFPLVMVVDSAGKSLHAWWSVGHSREESQQAFMRRATALGADKVTWRNDQFVRMPGGVRPKKNGPANQRVRFLVHNGKLAKPL